MEDSYIILTRNPYNGQLVAVTDDEGDIQEFESYRHALAVAQKTTCCLVWGYKIVGVTV